MFSAALVRRVGSLYDDAIEASLDSSCTRRLRGVTCSLITMADVAGASAVDVKSGENLIAFGHIVGASAVAVDIDRVLRPFAPELRSALRGLRR